MVHIFLNGEQKEVPGELKLDELLKMFALPTQLVAIELNKEVVRKKDWQETIVKDSDKIEVVHFVGGG